MDSATLIALKEAGLIPRPQGVDLLLVEVPLDGFFGFADNSRAEGFADAGTGDLGGVFAERRF
jgi:hypothetical protein